MKRYFMCIFLLIFALANSQECNTNFDLGYVEDFNEYIVPDLDDCWTKYPIRNGSWEYVKSTLEEDNTYINIRSSGGTSAMLISPELQNFGPDIRISFSIYSGPNPRFSIGTIADPSDKSTYTKFRDIDSYDDKGVTWRRYNIDFANYTGTDKYVAFELTGYSIIRFDDFKYAVSPECIQPIGLRVLEYHSSEVTVDWDDYSGANNWDIEYGEKGFQQGLGTVIENIPKPFSLSNLTASTEYDFYVKAKCSVSETSEWSRVGVFSTRCEAGSAGYSYDFDDQYTQHFNECWLRSRYSSLLSGGRNSDSERYLRVSGRSDTPEIIVTPELNDIKDTKRVKFWVNNFNGSSGFTIGTLSNPDDLNTFSAYRTFNSSSLPENKWVKMVINLDTYSGNDKYIAIRQDKETDNYTSSYLYFDEFVYENIPNCLEPNQLELISTLDRSAEIQWNEQALASSWEIEYGEKGFVHGEGITFTTSQTNATLPNLYPDSTYDVYVRSICGSELSQWTDYLRVHTACGPMQMEYTQTFDFENLANCWTSIPENSGRVYSYETIKYGNSGSSIRITNSVSEKEVFLISPEFTDLGANNNRVKFWYNSVYNNSDLIIGTMSDPKDKETFNPIKTILGTKMSYAVWDKVFVDLGDYSGTDRFIAIKFDLKEYVNRTSDAVLIDNFEYGIKPDCNSPIDFKVLDMNNGNVELSWNDDGASLYEVVYGEKGFWLEDNEGTKVSTSNKTITIEGLTSQREYDFYVRSICDNENFSDWSDKLIHDTSCGNSVVTGYTYNFDEANINECWKVYDYPSPTSSAYYYLIDNVRRGDSGRSLKMLSSYYGYGVMLVSPMISDLSTDKKITFWLSGFNGSLSVGTISDPNDYTTFSLLSNIEGTVAESEWEERTVYLKNYNGTDKYIAFKQGSPYSRRNNSHIDDFSYLQSVNCTDVINYNANVVSEKEIALSWESTGPETEWEINYRIEGASDEQSVSIITSNKSYALKDLIGNTTYEVKVRAICDVGLFSNWVSETIQTPCDLGLPGYIESFETNGQLNPCWTEIFPHERTYIEIKEEQNMSYQSNWVSGAIGYDLLPVSGSQFIKFANYHDSGRPQDMYLVSKKLEGLRSDKRIRFSLISQIRGSQDNFNMSTIQIGTMSDPNDISTFNLIETITSDQMSESKGNSFTPVRWKEHTIYFNNYTGINDDYIAIKHGDESGSSQFYLDHFIYELIPECAEPLYPKVIDERYDAVDISWQTYENSSPVSWEIEYGFSGFTIGEGTRLTADSEAYTINNLPDDTEFDFYVRANCGNFFSEWSVMQKFKTKCAGYEVGYFEDFESQSSGYLQSCWTAILPTTGVPYYDSVKDIVVVDNIGSNARESYSGTNSLRHYNEVFHPNGDANSDEIVVVTPRLIGLDNYKKISFWLNAVRNDYSAPLEIIIGTLSDPDDASTFTPYYTITDAIQNEGVYVKYDINFSDYNLTDEYVGIKQAAVNKRQEILIDDFEYSEIGCVTPTSLQAAQVSESEVRLTWQDNNTLQAPESWEVEYGPVGFEQGTGTVVQANSNPYNLNIGNDQKEYECYVRAFCDSENGYSQWSKPYAFKIACTINAPYHENFDSYDASTQYQDGGIPNFCWTKTNTTSLHNTENQHLQSNSQPNVVKLVYHGEDTPYFNTPGLLVSPFLSDFDNTKMIKFWLRNDYFFNPIGYKSGIVVGTMSNPIDIKTFKPFKEIKVNEIPIYGKEFVVDFSSYVGTDKYVAFIHDKTKSVTNLYLDDFYYQEKPTCIEPVNLKVSAFSDTSVKLSWENLNGSNAYEIEYGIKGFVQGNGIIELSSDNSYIVNGLNPETEYDFYVRAKCGNTDYSQWSNVKTVSTVCTISSLPWQENFRTMSVYGQSILPDCFKGTNNWVSSNSNLSSYQLGDGDSHYLHVTYDSDRLKTSLSTPMFYLEAGTTYTLTFKIRKEAGDYSSQGVAIKTGMGNANKDMTLKLNHFSEFNYGFYNYHPIETVFTPVVSGNYSFGLYFRFSAPIHTITVDSFSLVGEFDDTIDVSDDDLVFDFENILDPEIVLENTELTKNNVVFDDEVSGNVIHMRLASTLEDWISVEDETQKWIQNQNGINKVNFEVDGTNLDRLFMNFDLKQNYMNNSKESLFRVIINGQDISGNIYANTKNASKNKEGKLTSSFKKFEFDLSDFVGDRIKVSLQQLGRNKSETNGISDEVFLDNLHFTSEKTLGVEDANIDSIKLYPNPVESKLYIKNKAVIEYVEMYNLVGQKVYFKEINSNETTVDFSGFESAVYFIKIYLGDQVKMFKVVKE